MRSKRRFFPRCSSVRFTQSWHTSVEKNHANNHRTYSNKINLSIFITLTVCQIRNFKERTRISDAFGSALTKPLWETAMVNKLNKRNKLMVRTICMWVILYIIAHEVVCALIKFVLSLNDKFNYIEKNIEWRKFYLLRQKEKKTYQTVKIDIKRKQMNY